jgi:hypothetical protein
LDFVTRWSSSDSIFSNGVRFVRAQSIIFSFCRLEFSDNALQRGFDPRIFLG